MMADNNKNIFMFHRVVLPKISYNKYYQERNMSVELSFLILFIKKKLQEGLKFGSIEECITNKNFFHLTFDDGFREHLEVANILKKEFNIPKNSITFSVNVGNSINKEYSGMDVIYYLLEDEQSVKLQKILGIDANKVVDVGEFIKSLKKKIISMKPIELQEFFFSFNIDKSYFNRLFLSSEEIIELSKLFMIASHGVTHRDLTQHIPESIREIENSKNILETLIQKDITSFCYPEGKHSGLLEDICKKSGYLYGLAIDGNNTKFSIAREFVHM